MAREDFCFTYYDGDAARDKAHMTRLERGAYDDLISAQRKRGHLTIEDIKKVLSKDFDECWPSMEWVLKKDEEGKYFIQWVDTSIENSRLHSSKQKAKADKRWEKEREAKVIPQQCRGIDSAMPLEAVIGIEEELGKSENLKTEIGMEKTADVANKVWKDQLWRQGICMGCTITEPQLQKWMAQFNTSVSNDAIHDFSPSKYKKIFRGWLMKEKEKGRSVELTPPQQQATGLNGQLKNINNLT